MPKFSIIIPVRSFNSFLRESVSHLKKLDYQNFEVIIVMDEFEYTSFDDGRFKVLISGSKSPGEKRNMGAQEAAGEIIGFLDDDAYPEKDWLKKAEEVFTDPHVYALGAPAVTPKDAPFFERMSGRILESMLASAGTIYRHKPSKRRTINDYPTVNLFVRRDTFLSVGGFNTEFWPGEDTKLCLDLVKQCEGEFIYDPLPVVYHHRRELFAPHLKQISRYGKHRGQFARSFPETSRLFCYFVPSLFVLGLVTGLATFFLFPAFIPLYLSVSWIYFIVLLINSVKAGVEEKSFRAALYFAVGVFLTHLVYGYNFIIGFVKKPKLELRGFDQVTGNYIGG